MEIKPAEKEIVDRKDLRYKRKVSNKGIKDMNKEAYVRLVSGVMAKNASTDDVIKAIIEHVKDNRGKYAGGAIGAGLGALSAIGGPWWKYLTNIGVGTGVGIGAGHMIDKGRRALTATQGELRNTQGELRAAQEDVTRAILERDDYRRDLERALARAERAENDFVEARQLVNSHRNDLYRSKRDFNTLAVVVNALRAERGQMPIDFNTPGWDTMKGDIIIPEAVDAPTTTRNSK